MATILLVIALVSASSLESYLLAGQPLSASVTLLFVAGLAIGTSVGRNLSPVKLQNALAVVIVMVAGFVIMKNFA